MVQINEKEEGINLSSDHFLDVQWKANFNFASLLVPKWERAVKLSSDYIRLGS